MTKFAHNSNTYIKDGTDVTYQKNVFKNIIFNGMTVIKVYSKGSSQDPNKDPSSVSIDFIYNNTGYQISYALTDPTLNDKSPIIPDILSTFKFSVSTSKEALYKELITTSVVQNELSKAKSANSANNSEYHFEIINIHKNNIVEGNIYPDTGNGYALWIYKDNGQWKKLYTGQQAPDCKLLEGMNIESGVDCEDFQSNQLRKTR